MGKEQQTDNKLGMAMFPVPGYVEDNDDELTSELGGNAKLFLDAQRGPDGHIVIVRRPLKELPLQRSGGSH